MAKPLIPAEVIYERALGLLDAEGTGALTTRRLAAELKISTRTLYQQVGSREHLIRTLVARHFSLLRLEFHDYANWESTAVHWCLGLRSALLDHPYLTELMTVDDGAAVMDYVDKLLDSTLREGISRQLGLECCRALVNVTINHSVMEVRGMREPKLSRDSLAESRRVKANFSTTVRWILAGVRADAAASDDASAADGTRKGRRSS
ncbi:TetR family transcriptional regulator [Mycobacterium sp. OTB74]|jgi:AcrR family transcriptional regulator|uniref:TetR/AcrR family transcriptional regulator n=1 Tax=Mycobacterium sp. OTB74 TaxID=1853452 RepID=UPI002473F41E|nr:TetR family transcriptional regulator [Mycobacterium sp. OTB74]MDH6246516.1 AcrR family transcriptional regulator [Mycobacterium sp. OTB74]